MNITAIIVTLIGALAAAVSAFVIPYLKAKAGQARWEQFIKIVEVAVNAAEQLGLTDVVKDKFAYAEDQIGIALEKHGLTYDADTIRAAIEAAVKAVNDDALWLASEVGLLVVEEG